MTDDLLRFIKEKDEEEETLSLCDLPLVGDESTQTSIYDYSNKHHSTSSDEELFQFFETTSNMMSSAEDMILCGKLLPYRSPPPPSPPPSLSKHKHSNKTTTTVNERFEFPPINKHRKSESLNDLQNKYQSSPKIRFVRSSHSLDYKKLSRNSSSRIGSLVASNDLLSSSNSNPRWRLLMFGFMRTPTEMELKDIKNRQNRRIPSSMFSTTYEGEERVSVKRDQDKKGSWRLIRVLSCKGEGNEVIPSLRCIASLGVN